MRIKLIDIAAARSGDKNNICNIGVLANTTADYATGGGEMFARGA